MENQGDISPSEKEALAREFRDLEEIRNREAKSRAVVLEILGDIPDADITPPKNVLFVCKLNPVTEEGDLKIIFSRFGTVKKCDIIRDYVTGDSLQYAFIEFETEDSCNEAYFKMQNVLIDDRRIHVDFCQSVSGFWKRYYLKDSFTRKKLGRYDYKISRESNRGSNFKVDRDYNRSSHRKHHYRSRKYSLSPDRHNKHSSRSDSYRKARKHTHKRSRSRERNRYRRDHSIDSHRSRDYN